MATKFGTKNGYVLMGSKVMQRSAGVKPGVKLLRNALWQQNLVGRTPDRKVIYCWGQGSCGVNLRSNCLEMLYCHQNVANVTGVSRLGLNPFRPITLGPLALVPLSFNLDLMSSCLYFFSFSPITFTPSARRSIASKVIPL